jgi:phage shock protein PspC (stress-responsive transcriptional regulator)
MLKNIVALFEKKAFGVCTWWGEKLGIPTTNIRLYFIYLSFFTVGSPIIVYFLMAFILQHKRYFKIAPTHKSSFWDLK